MARALLNVKAIQAAKPADREYLLTDGEGLFLRVLPTGRKTWQFIYSQGQQRRKLSFGEASDVSLALARERAQAERARIAAGDCPRLALVVREEAQADELARLTSEAERRKAEDFKVKDLADVWLRDGVSRFDGNAALRRSFDIHLLPRLGSTKVRALTEFQIRDVLRTIGRGSGKNRTAVALLADLRQMFRWAERRKPWRQLLVDGNPAVLVDPKQIVQANYDLANERDRVLSSNEICLLRDALLRSETGYLSAQDKRSADRPVGRETQLALWIMLATCCRVGELCSARWEHINLETGEWLVPRENTKTKRGEWLVFLSAFARQQFEDLHALTGSTAWCFPARDQKGPLDGKAISKQVGDRQFMHKSRKVLMHRCNDNKLVLPGGPWTPHDLRRTGSTLMQSLGVQEHIRERCLNHIVGGKIGRIYGRYEFAKEKRAAWDVLGDRLQVILSAEAKVPAGEVAVRTKQAGRRSRR